MLSELDNRSLNENQTNNVDTILAKFISVYQKSYSWNHVLISLIEGSKNTSTKKKCRYRNFSKALDSVPQNILITKKYVYGFWKNSLVFFYPCLKKPKQNLGINSTHSAITFSCTSRIYTRTDFVYCIYKWPIPFDIRFC